jgi:hypothetical protein
MRVSFSRHSSRSINLPVSASFVFYIIAANFLVIAGGLYWASGAVAKDARLLAAEGTEIEAEVLDRRIVEKIEYDDDDKSSGSRTRKTTTYCLTIAYSPSENERIEMETSVSQARYETSGTGAKIKLFYAPSNPRLIEFEKGEKAKSASFLRWFGMGLAVMAVGLAALGIYMRKPSQSAA